MIVDGLTELIGNTPTLRLRRLVAARGLAGKDQDQDQGGIELLAKLEMWNPYSLKDRPALFMIRDAERSGVLAPGGTIVEASSGNAGIALTYIGRARGYRVIICMSELMSAEHRDVMRALGAEVHLTPAADGIRGSRGRARALAAEIEGAVYMEQHDNPANRESHAETTAAEIWRDTGGDVDVFIHGLGSCGTITGVSRVLRAHKPSVRIIGYEPEGAALMSQGVFKAHRVLGIEPGFVPGLFERAAMDEIVTVSEEDAFRTCREIAAHEGLLAGITSGASVHVALELAKRPEYRGATMVVLFCDSGKDYLSVSGLFSGVSEGKGERG